MIYSRWYSSDLPAHVLIPPAEREAARVRVLKRRIKHRIWSMMIMRLRQAISPPCF